MALLGILNQQQLFTVSPLVITVFKPRVAVPLPYEIGYRSVSTALIIRLSLNTDDLRAARPDHLFVGLPTATVYKHEQAILPMQSNTIR